MSALRQIRVLEARPILRLETVTKSFGSLKALDGVSFAVAPGQVVGLAGSSGSGKTVLIKLLAGIHAWDSGVIVFDGHALYSPFLARSLGIETIHQKPELVETMDICDNIFIGREIALPALQHLRLVSAKRQMETQAARILNELGFTADSIKSPVINLSGEERQLIAIARTMLRPSRLVLIDDPTPLSYHYQKKLLSLIHTWQQAGTAIIFSSHNLDHLFAATDSILVLRKGQLVANVRTDDTTQEQIVNAMVGTTDRQQLTPTIWALDSYYQARENAEKLSLNQSLLAKDLKERDALNRQLMSELNEQVKALDRANLALQDAQRRLLTEREEERKALARELHDESLQDLLGINYQLEQIESELPERPDIQSQLLDVRNNIRGLIEDLRSICSNLRPPTIDSLGLSGAVKSYADEWSRKTGIRTILRLDENVGRLPEATELSVFRIIQESLNNVWKHAAADEVHVRLKRLSPRMLMVSIGDDGHGLTGDFDLAAFSARRHYGLLGISERVALLGGRLLIRNQADGGLLIRVEIPHPKTPSGG